MAAQAWSPLLTGCLASNYTASEVRTKLAAVFSVKGARETATFSRTPSRGQKTEGERAGLAQHGLQAPPRTLLSMWLPD